MCRDYTPSYPTVQDEGKEIVGSPWKRGTATITLAAHSCGYGVTDSKESVNVVRPWPKERIGGKSAKGFLVERVFVEPLAINFPGKADVDGVLRWIGHPSGPQGKVATLNYYEYVDQAELTFDLYVHRDQIPHDLWPELWSHAEMNGLGALRSQSFGRFVVTQFERVED